MAPSIDWTAVDDLARGATVDDEVIDNVIKDVRPIQESDFKNDPDKMYKLFKSVLNAYEYKEQETEDLLTEQANSEAEKERQITDLQEQLKDAQRYPSGPGQSDVNFWIQKHKDLSDLLQDYEAKEHELNMNLQTAEDEKARFQRDNDDLKQRNKELDTDVNKLKEDLKEFQEMFRAQRREKLEAKGTYDSEMTNKLSEKNEQISDLIEQITQLEQLNKELEEKNHGVKEEMERAHDDMVKMADEYEKMKRIIDGTDKHSENIHKDNEAYKLQVADLREQLRVKNDEVDAIVETVNSKVEEWKQRLAEKDRALVEDARMIATLQERIKAAALDEDRIKIDELTKTLKEKEDLIKQLQTSLEQVISDLNDQTAIVQDLRKESGTNKEIIAYKNQIRTQQEEIKQLKDDVEDASSHRLAAEVEARQKDSELNKALKRIDDILSGEYGLAEAVQEIKECKAQIKFRDQDIEDLTRQINRVEEKLNDVLDENDEFRDRLGIGARDMTDIAKLRKSRALRQQQYRAENQILLKEIERLEEERIEMKQLIRSQAQTYSQKALSEGLHQDDVQIIEEFIEDLKRKRRIGRPMTPKNPRLPGGPFQQMDWRMDELNKQADKAEVTLQMTQTENTRLNQERSNLLKENTHLRKAMQDILEAIKNSKENATSGPIEIASLERLLHAIEVQNMRGDYDSGIHLKAQVDQLTGRNEELRRELRSARTDLAAATGEKATLNARNETLKDEVAALSKLTEGKGGSTVVHTIPLPENIDPTAADIITALNEQLIQVMDDISKRDERVKQTTEALEQSRRRFHVLRNQTHQIYADHFKAKKNWEDEREKHAKEKETLLESIEKDVVRLQELDRLLDSLSTDPDTLKQRLAETTRKISLLRVNEKTLIRHHKALEFSEEQLRNENNRLRNNILQMEKAVSERLGYLQRYKDMASYKIAVLQKNMDSSVPESELTNANKKYDELTSKYRDLLQKENHFVARNTKLDTLQAEVKILNEELEVLRSELAIEKEKRHTMGEALRRVESSSAAKLSGTASLGSSSYEISSVMQKVTVLEMKELNERQRADHASRMYEQIKGTVDSMESRNLELEQKFAELTKMNLASQQIERELRDELSAVVPLSVSEADRKKITKLEKEGAKMKIRMSQLQDMSEIAQNQLKTLQLQQHGREREMQSLRQQVREFQIQSDNKSLIGKLHKQILNLQSIEADQKLKLDKTTSQVKKLEAHVLRQEKLLDEKEIMVFHVRTETTNRNRQLKKTIQSLRQQFSGALPLQQQEKFSQSMIRLQQDKATIQQELKRVRKEREKLEDELAEAKIKEEGLQELKKTIKDGRGAQKLEEWCRKMDTLRLQDLKLQRQVVRQTDEINYLEKVVAQHEKTIATREEDIVDMLRNQEKQQLEWEQRETELERMIDDFDVRQREVVKNAKRLDEIPDLLPDPTLPLDIQLTRALKQIADYNRKHKDLLSQIKFYESDSHRLKNRIHVLEGDVFARDRMVNDLRMRIPEGTSSSGVTIIKESVTKSESMQQLHVAMETIETLKKRLKQKEESIERYKKMLEEAHSENVQAIKQHENELSAMQRRIHSKTDEAFGKFRKTAISVVEAHSNKISLADQPKRMSELEALVQEQDIALTALMDRVKAANADIKKHKEMIGNLRKQADKERNKMSTEYDLAVSQLKDLLSGKERSIDELEMKYARSQADLQNERDNKNISPAVTMKNMVARLRAQLQEKDAKHQKLSEAIRELRADMLQQTQENIRAANEGSNTNAAVNALVQKKTEAYREEIDELNDKIAMLQRGLKQERVKHENVNSELKKLLNEVEKKTLLINRLKNDKQKIDQENEKLRERSRQYIKPGDKSKQVVRKLPTGKATDGDGSSGDEDDDDDNKPVKESLVTAIDAGNTEEVEPPSRLPRVTYNFSDEKTDRIKELENEVDRLKDALENSAAPGKNELEFAKWETKKLWQGRVENLKVKLQEKERNTQQLEKHIASLRETVNRLEREKTRKLVGFNAPIYAVGQASDPPAVTKATRDESHRIEELSNKLHEVSEENSQLRRENNLPRNVAIAEMEARNRSLTERLEALEREMTMKGVHAQTASSADQLHRDRENKFQSELLKLYSENSELKFEVEQSKLDLPRLRDRISDQQRYIELLKAEKREAEMRADRFKASHLKRGGKDAGTTGKSPAELEKMIGMLKKVVERVQRENETLKKAPGVVSNEVMDNVKKENAQLKQRINMMTRQIGGQLSSRYESKTLGVEKLMKENARLQKELTKEANGHEKLKASKVSLQNLYEKLKTEIDNLKERLRSAENRAPRVSGLGSKGYGSVVANKMLESKLTKNQKELEDKNSQVEDLKIVLQDSTKRENDLLKENEELREQIEILERFPPEAGGVDADTVRALQQARVEIANLEKNKKDLEGMLHILQRHISPKNDKDQSSAMDDDMLSKLRQYDTTLEKNIKLKTDLALIKQERDRLREETDRLEKDLSKFDDDFFDEIEDMKYNYAEAVKRNVLYEEQLRNLSTQFNVDVEIPNDDDGSTKS